MRVATPTIFYSGSPHIPHAARISALKIFHNKSEVADTSRTRVVVDNDRVDQRCCVVEYVVYRIAMCGKIE